MNRTGFSIRFVATPVLLLLASGVFCLQATAADDASGIEKRLENVERLLQNQGLLDLWEQLHALQSEVAKLRGQLEVNNHELEKLREKQRKLFNDLDTRLQALARREQAAAKEVATPQEDMPAGQSAPPPVAGTEGEPLTLETVANAPEEKTVAGPDPEKTRPGEGTPQADPIEVQSAYQSAFRLLKEAEYDQAITAFSTFLQDYPDNRYSDNARYWMGESYFVTRRFGQAISEYMTLINDYPDSKKAPTALLRIGDSYTELGQTEDARQYYQTVIDRYPDTRAAKDAVKQLNPS